MKYDWILFDFDRTLADFTETSKMAFSSAFKFFGLKETEGHYAVYEQHNKDVWTDFEDGNIDALTLRRKRFDDFFLVAGIKGIDGLDFNAIYMEKLVEHSFLLDGAMDLLQHLHGKVKMGIITNGLKEAQRPRIKLLGIEHFFDVIVVSDEIGVSKPSKAYFDYALELCGLPERHRVLIVGDSLKSDIKGGISSGLPTCWCNLFGMENQLSFQADFEISNLLDMRDLILL